MVSNIKQLPGGEPMMAWHRSDRGASAIVVAITMLVLMGMAALVVDVGAGFSERRQDQSAVDAAVMAGALSFSVSAEEVREQVLAYTETNIDTTYSVSEWEAIWDSCTDPDRPATYQPVPARATMANPFIDCISIAAIGRVRVRLPDQTVGTTFGKVLGFNELRTHAVAEAKLEPTVGGGGVLPFGVLGSAVDGSELCLSQASTGNALPPCTGSASGNFGTINSPWFGNKESVPATTASCPPNPGAPYLAQNIALGLDHTVGRNSYYGPYPSPLLHPLTGMPPAQEHFITPTPVPWGPWQKDQCSVVGGGLAEGDDGVPVDTLLANTGLANSQPIADGLINNTSHIGTPTRLQQGPGPDRSIITKKGGGSETWNLDNRPLWEFINPLATGVPSTCDRGLFPANGDYSTGTTATDNLRLCLTDYRLGGFSGVLFDADIDSDNVPDIVSSPRFNFVPQFWYSAWGNGSHWQPVYDYRPVFLAGIWLNCQGGGPSLVCDDTAGVVFYPGEGTSSLCDTNPSDPSCGSNLKALNLNQVSGWLLPNSSVPPGVFGGPSGQFDPFSAELFK